MGVDKNPCNVNFQRCEQILKLLNKQQSPVKLELGAIIFGLELAGPNNLQVNQHFAASAEAADWNNLRQSLEKLLAANI